MASSTTHPTAASTTEVARPRWQEPERTLRPGSARARALRRALRNPVTVAGLFFVLVLILMALLADLLPLDDPLVMDVTARRAAPGTPGHPLGTDSFGRDLLSRTFYGARLSLFIALTVVGLSTLIGVVLGTMVGFVGGFLDTVVSRIWDVMLSFPGILLFIVIMGTLGAGVTMAIIALTIGSIPAAGRLMRERVLAQRQQVYVEAAQVLGASTWRVMFRHVLPNSLTSVLIHAALAVPGIILAEAALSYLGLGVPPPEPSWGKMIAEGQAQLLLAPWQSLIPGACILLATWGFNLLGDGLRDFLDPTQVR
jgi:peptide/nickel transport system permease protein